LHNVSYTVLDKYAQRVIYVTAASWVKKVGWTKSNNFPDEFLKDCQW